MLRRGGSVSTVTSPCRQGKSRREFDPPSPAKEIDSYIDPLTAVKKLTRTGNSLAIVLDKGLLHRARIDAGTPLEVSTDGELIVISPVRPARRTAKLKRVMEKAHARYAGAFKRLAE